MANVLLSLLLVLLLALILQLTLKVKLFFNVKNNSGVIKVKLANVEIINYKISFCDRCLKFTTKKGKNKYLPLNFNEQTIEEYNNFQEILFKKTYFKNFSVYLNFGLKDSNFKTAMICGYFDILTKIFYCLLKTKKNETEFSSKIYPNFNSTVIKIGVKAKISLSIYDLIWSFFESKISSKTKRSVKNARQQNSKFNGTSTGKNQRIN